MSSRWSCERRRNAREAKLDRALEEAEKRRFVALAHAAGSYAPHPTAWVKLPLEERAEIHFVAGSKADLDRLNDWLANGRYRDLAEEALLALRRDANL